MRFASIILAVFLSFAADVRGNVQTVALQSGSGRPAIQASATPLPAAGDGNLVRSFALGCGILCLATAVQQALTARRPRAARVRVK